MVFKKHNPGCGSLSSCACEPDGCTLQYDPFDAAELPADLVQRAGAWTINEEGHLETADADASIVTSTAHFTTAMTAEARLRGHAAGEQLRVIVCWRDDTHYLFGELELGDCGEGLLRLYEVDGGDPLLLAELEAHDAVPEEWHTLRVCYAPDGSGCGSGGGSGSGGGLLSARLRTARYNWGNQTDVYRYLEADVEASGRRAGLGTGALADAAEYSDFTWYRAEEECPDCRMVCTIFHDEFHRQPREQDDPGCNWEVDGEAAVQETSEFVSEVRVTPGTTLLARVAHFEDTSVMRARVEFDALLGADWRLMIAWLDEENYLFARIHDDGQSLSVGEVLGGTETILRTDPVPPLFALAGELQVCFDGASITANYSETLSHSGPAADTNVSAPASDPGGRRAGLAVASATGGYVKIFNFGLSPRDQNCGWCSVDCGSCAGGVAPISWLVVLDGWECEEMNVVLEVSQSGFFPPADCRWQLNSIFISQCEPELWSFLAVWLFIIGNKITLNLSTNPFFLGGGTCSLDFQKVFGSQVPCDESHELTLISTPCNSLGIGTLTIIPQ